MEKKREEKPFSSAAGRRRRLACLSLLCALYLLPQTVFASDAGGQRDLTEAEAAADPDDVSAKGTGLAAGFFFRKQGCGQMVRTGRLWLPAVCPAVCPFLLRDRKHYFSDPSIIKLRMIRSIGYNEICAL